MYKFFCVLLLENLIQKINFRFFYQDNFIVSAEKISIPVRE